jgi:hypothetical protein
MLYIVLPTLVELKAAVQLQIKYLELQMELLQELEGSVRRYRLDTFQAPVESWARQNSARLIEVGLWYDQTEYSEDDGKRNLRIEFPRLPDASSAIAPLIYKFEYDPMHCKFETVAHDYFVLEARKVVHEYNRLLPYYRDENKLVALLKAYDAALRPLRTFYIAQHGDTDLMPFLDLMAKFTGETRKEIP